jgi:hypothetical protein
MNKSVLKTSYLFIRVHSYYPWGPREDKYKTIHVEYLQYFVCVAKSDLALGTALRIFIFILGHHWGSNNSLLIHRLDSTQPHSSVHAIQTHLEIMSLDVAQIFKLLTSFFMPHAKMNKNSFSKSGFRERLSFGIDFEFWDWVEWVEWVSECVCCLINFIIISSSNLTIIITTSTYILVFCTVLQCKHYQ